MAFDNKQVAGQSGDDLDLAREHGRTYVPLAAEPPRFMVLDEQRAATLSAWADVLVPGDDHWPPASATASAEYVDNCAARAPRLRRALRDAVDALHGVLLERGHAGTLDDLDADGRVAVLRQVERDHGQLFGFVLELVYEGYYRDPHVQDAVVEERTGFIPSVPLTGIRLEPFDETLVEHIRARPAQYREVSDQ